MIVSVWNTPQGIPIQQVGKQVVRQIAYAVLLQVLTTQNLSHEKNLDIGGEEKDEDIRNDEREAKDDSLAVAKTLRCP